MKNLIKKLIEIQKVIEVPKKRYNKFSNFYYRNAEDILEAATPLLNERDLFLSVNDTVEFIGSRYYVVATVVLYDINGETFSVSARAREVENRAKFDESQLTGSASSYAKKYALSNLFGLDDGNDADSLDNSKKEIKKEVSGDMVGLKNDVFNIIETMASKEGIRILNTKEIVDNLSKEELNAFISKFQSNKKEDLNKLHIFLSKKAKFEEV